MKIKIVSDGTPKGTRVVNEATGEKLEHVMVIEWRMKHDSLAEAVVTFRNVSVELTNTLSSSQGRIHKRRINLENA